MERIRALIVDDEPLAREGVRRLLETDQDVEILDECVDGVEAIEAIRKEHPDLVFLDVQMPEVDGFQVLEALAPDDIPLVIFVTAYDEHAVRAFEVHALDYLLKPYEDERFRQALQTAKNRLAQQKKGEAIKRVLDLLGEGRTPRGEVSRIMIKSNGHITFLRTAEIDWIEAQGDYVSLHLHGRSHLIRENIGDLEDRLRPDAFMRIHRSTIVNVSRIKELQPLFHGDYVVVLIDGTRLTMSRSFREKVFQQLAVVP